MQRFPSFKNRNGLDLYFSPEFVTRRFKQMSWLDFGTDECNQFY